MPVDAASPSGCIHLLGHDDYAVVLTDVGAGASRWKGLAVTRWHDHDDANEQGGYVYLRDTRGGAVWSAGTRPCGGHTLQWFDDAMVRFVRRDGAITSTLEVAVDPDFPVEVRGIGLRNDGRAGCDIEMTSYLELALAASRDDAAHPAYSKMFVQTALDDGVLLAWRRKKDPSEPDIWIAHALVVDGAEAGRREWETDRARFIGRDRSLAAPAAMDPGVELSGSVGTVLDPIFSLRARVAVDAGATRRAALVTAAAASRADALALILRYLTPSACAGVFARARAAAPQRLRSAGIDAATAQRYQRIAGALVRSDATLRADAAVAANGTGGAPVLWAKGISGDLPIIVARILDPPSVALADDLVRAQRYWRARQMFADLALLDASDGPEAAEVRAALQALSDSNGGGDKASGALFVLRDADLDERFRAGLYTAAAIVLDGAAGNLATRFPSRLQPVMSHFAPPTPSRARGGTPGSLPKPGELEFWNGIGGFAKDDGDYITVLDEDRHTPMPWSHIVANPGFGFLVTATGGGYAWATNSQQNQITRWSNDAVCDPPGEVFLLRDCGDGAEWSATASPVRVPGATYTARFGPGFARFDARIHGTETTLTQCVAGSDPVKFSRLTLRNRSRRTRRIAIAQTVDWLLGPIGGDPRATTQVESDPRRSAVFAQNAWRDEFATATAFIACSADACAVGSEAGTRSAAVVVVELAPDASADVVFLLGEGSDRTAAEELVRRYRQVDFDAVLADACKSWGTLFNPLQVETPHRSIDLLVNRWLPYQVLACRLWARTAFYQASGAYGFRDQLQDVGALCVARPDLARQHILLSASRQFEEGDAQHWWLPPSGKGVRTRIVDDRLWLPYTVAHYVATTGDTAILATQVPFVHGDALQPGQSDAFFAPARSATEATLFEHCARAIEASLATGAHGLPLMGTGDWNDGMNRVGAGGKGESVWMGWFVCRVIADFAPLAEARRDPRASSWRDHARALQLALETRAWDGGWYRRAFYDDGTPLGSAVDRECRIESMAQSWAVISGAGDPERAPRAMAAVDENLVRRDAGLVALFSEPFDQTAHDPGYIKGYPPGLRENGGQYTHGSIWSLVAFAMLGDGDKVGELLRIFDPVRKSDTPAKIAHYMVEPYVQCADVYSVAPHVGRGGWTWYSGSAGWTYRAIVEWVLGIRLRGDRLHLDPCIPRDWQGFALTFRRGETAWRIELENPDRQCRGVAAIEVDGVTLEGSDAGIALVDDGATHHVRVVLQEERNR